MRLFCLLLLALSLAAQDRPVSWGRLAPNLAADQKSIWTFPAQVVRGRHFWPVLSRK